MDVILVVGLRLGCLNHAFLTVEAIAARGLTLAGWIGNAIDPGFARREANLATLAARVPAPCLGIVPWMTKPSVGSRRGQPRRRPAVGTHPSGIKGKTRVAAPGPNAYDARAVSPRSAGYFRGVPLRIANRFLKRSVVAGAAAMLASLPARADWGAINMPRGVSELSHDIYDLHMLIFWICVAIAVVVFGAMIYRDRQVPEVAGRGRRPEARSQHHGSRSSGPSSRS